MNRETEEDLCSCLADGRAGLVVDLHVFLTLDYFSCVVFFYWLSSSLKCIYLKQSELELIKRFRSKSGYR